MQALLCPSCRSDLKERKLDSGAAWVCADCKGLSLNLAVLRAQVPRQVVRGFWSQVLEGSQLSERLCPSCEQSLWVVTSGGDPPLELDACAPCQLLWFDFHELTGVGGSEEATLSSEARSALAQAQLEVIAEGRAIQEQARALVLLAASEVWPHPLLAAHLFRRP